MRGPLLILIALLCLYSSGVTAQPGVGGQVTINILDSSFKPVPNSSVSLLNKDSNLVKTLLADSNGTTIFTDLSPGYYIARATMINHHVGYSSWIDLQTNDNAKTSIVLSTNQQTLNEVVVNSQKAAIRFLSDRTVINVASSIINTGSSVLEFLKKSPGVTLDKDGRLSLRGKSNVQVMIDGKLIRLSGSDLENMLAGMNSSEIEEVELITSPSAKYDASGNAGLINLKTVKGSKRGFNGSIGSSYGQGKYAKFNETINLNYRTAKMNSFLNYGYNNSAGLTDLYAMRSYHDANGNVTATLEQPFYKKNFGYYHTLKAGFDYFLSKNTTIGFAANAFDLKRHNNGSSLAIWRGAAGNEDSTIQTVTTSFGVFRQAGINLNVNHHFSSTKDILINFDAIGYKIHNQQYFENSNILLRSAKETTEGRIPSRLNIISGSADYNHQIKNATVSVGWKSSKVSTDNFAQYYNLINNGWEPDLSKTNNFIYDEYIHAVYANFQRKKNAWDIQAGLRYELTNYNANQLGNAVVKDSSFSRSYDGLFPSANISYTADTSNTFSVKMGRRLDRPMFQKLNPFSFIINKYTYQQGNPYLRPQYSWNFEISHQYKDILQTSLEYSVTSAYFSQVFTTKPGSDVVIYTFGNVGNARNLGLSISFNKSILPFWSTYAMVQLNHKEIDGVPGFDFKGNVNQATFNLNNQFKFGKNWAAELNGSYTTKHQEDLQEILDPTGQLSVGLSKQLMNNKLNIRLAFADIFYTEVMKGWSYFQTSTEYFWLKSDSRVGTISIQYRFGKAAKNPQRRASSSATEVTNRIGG